MLKKTRMAVIILEYGFLSNFDETKKLVTLEYQKALSPAIVDGILDYFEKIAEKYGFFCRFRG